MREKYYFIGYRYWILGRRHCISGGKGCTISESTFSHKAALYRRVRDGGHCSISGSCTIGGSTLSCIAALHECHVGGRHCSISGRDDSIGVSIFDYTANVEGKNSISRTMFTALPEMPVKTMG